MELTCVSISLKEELEAVDEDMACTVELAAKSVVTGTNDDGKDWSIFVTKAHCHIYLPREDASKFKLGDKYELELPI